MAEPVCLIVVDDRPDLRETIARCLGEYGFVVSAAATGASYMLRAGQDATRFRPILDAISSAQVREAFDTLPIRIMLLDRQHRYCYVNKEWCEFNPQDGRRGSRPHHCRGVGRGGVRNRSRQAERALAGEIVHRDGWGQGGRGWRYVQTTFAPVRDATGRVKG